MTGYNLDEKSGFFSIKSPTKVFKKGEAVDIRHYNSFDAIKATVLDLDEHTVKVQAKDKTPDFSAFPEDHVILNYFQGEDVTVLAGAIDKVHFLDPLEFTMQCTKIDKMKDLRKSERFAVSLKADLKIIGVAESRFAIVKNISLGGIKINTKEDIMMEDMLEATVKLDKASKTTFKGRVVRKTKLHDYIEYGIEISEIAESNLKNLHHFIYQMENL